jgi:hypothetical protein
MSHFTPVFQTSEIHDLLTKAKGCSNCGAGNEKLFITQGGKLSIFYRVECGSCTHHGPEANRQENAVKFWNWMEPAMTCPLEPRRAIVSCDREISERDNT